MSGGVLEGLPVITSTNVPGDATAGYSVVLAVQNDILVAEGGLTIDASARLRLNLILPQLAMPRPRPPRNWFPCGRPAA